MKNRGKLTFSLVLIVMCSDLSMTFLYATVRWPRATGTYATQHWARIYGTYNCINSPRFVPLHSEVEKRETKNAPGFRLLVDPCASPDTSSYHNKDFEIMDLGNIKFGVVRPSDLTAVTPPINSTPFHSTHISSPLKSSWKMALTSCFLLILPMALRGMWSTTRSTCGIL